MNSLSTSFYASGVSIGIGIMAVVTITLTTHTKCQSNSSQYMIIRIIQSILGYLIMYIKNFTCINILLFNISGTRGSNKLAQDNQSLGSVVLSEDTLMDAIADITADTMRISHIYKSFHSALFVLKLHVHLYLPSNISPSLRLDIDNYILLLHRIENNISSVHKILPKIKLIAIEGLRKSGKTSLCHEIVQRLPNRYRTLPCPEELEAAEEYFSSAPDPVSAAFAYIRNYVLVNQIYEDYDSNPLDNRHYFIDAYYHGTCTSIIMSQVDNPEDEVIVSAAAYEWPMDLPVPHMVRLIHITCIN